MRTRLFSLILALFAVLLPQATWAQSQGYAELKVNEAGKTFANYEDNDITYTLTFYYGTKPSDTETAKYFDTDNLSGMSFTKAPDWLGFKWDSTKPYSWGNSENYTYAPKITSVIFDTSFASATPKYFSFWFEMCTNASFYGLENVNTSMAEKLNNMFYTCRSIESIDVSTFDLSNARDISEMFGGCTNLTTIIGLDQWDISNVTTLYNMFYKCYSLLSLDLKTWNTSNVSTMSGMFLGCHSLRSIDVSHFNTEKVENIQSMFGDCLQLTEINLSSFNTPNINNFRSAFVNIPNLTLLDISNFDTRSAITTFDMFKNLSKLTTIYVGDNWDLSNMPENYTYRYSGQNNQVVSVTVEASKDMFKGCTALVGGANTAYDANHVNRIYAVVDDPANGHPGYLTSAKAFAVYSPTDHTLYLCNAKASSDFATSYTPEGSSTTLTGNIVVSNNLAMTNTTSGKAWDLQQALLTADDYYGTDFSLADIQRVVIEPSFANTRPTTLASWFEGMTNLSTIEGTDHIRTNNTTSTAKMFKGTAITSFDANDWDFFTTRNVTDMSGMFADCTSLTTLDLSSFNFSTANVTDMSDMFSGCSNLKYTTYTDANDNTPFNIDMFNTLKVTDMSGMFRGCAALAGLLNLNRLATENVTDMSEMFQNCTGLTTLQLGGANTKSVTAADRMFQGCSNLETIKVNLIWDMQKGQSTAGMFDGCNKLTGQNGSKYITYLSSDPSNAATGKYAVIDDDSTPGYLTEMVPVVLDLYADGDNEAQIQSYGATGQKINSVRVHRTFTAGQWTTLCLPFDMTATQVTNIFGISSGDLLTLSRYNRTSHAVTYTAATEIKTGVPYLIKPSRVPTFKDDDGNTQYGFAVPNRTISAQTSNVNSNGLILKANYSSATITPGTSEELYTLKAGQSTLGTDLSSTAAYITPEENHVGGLSAYFMLYTADYVTVTMRNSTLDIFSCNYDLDFTDSHLKAWIASAFTPEGNGGKVVLTRITDVPAGTGVVITTTDANSLIDNVPIGTSNIIVRNLLVGTPDGANFTPQMNGNTIYVVSKSTGSIGNPTRGGTMGAGLGWLAIPTDEVEKLKAANGGLANIRFVFEGEDSEATGIEIVEEDAAKADGIYYNLNGQRVTAPTKGIYIKDGKKVYVK